MHSVDSHVIGVSARHGTWTVGHAREVLKGRDRPIDAEKMWEKLRGNEQQVLKSEIGDRVWENFTEQERLVEILDLYQDRRDLKVKGAPKGGLDIRGIVKHLDELLRALDGAP